MEQLIIQTAIALAAFGAAIHLGIWIHRTRQAKKERKERLKLVTPEHIDEFFGTSDSVDALKETIAGADKL